MVLKNDLTIYLAKEAVEKFESISIGYAVSYGIKCDSNLEGYDATLTSPDKVIILDGMAVVNQVDMTNLKTFKQSSDEEFRALAALGDTRTLPTLDVLEGMKIY